MTSPVPSTGEDETSATKAARERTKEEAKEAAGATEREEKASEEPDSESGEEDSEPDEEAGKGGIEDGEDAESEPPPEVSALGDISPRGDSKERHGASEEEGGRIPLAQTDRVSAPEGGTTERDDDYLPDPYERAADDVDRLLDKMAERAACEQLENERLRELNDAAQSISYGNVHSGVNITVKRMASVDESFIEQYDRIAGPLLTISRQLQRSLIRQLKDSRRGGKQTGLLLGRRLDPHDYIWEYCLNKHRSA